jgi:hypothetical protein
LTDAGEQFRDFIPGTQEVINNLDVSAGLLLITVPAKAKSTLDRFAHILAANNIL